MINPNLPADLVDFLQQDKQLEYDPVSCEAGLVTLLTLDKLKVEFFPMSPNSSEDKHANENGSYLVAGVSLLASCDDYDPVGLLIWLPLDKQYGTWDGEHGTLRVFPDNVTWSAISKNPAHYLNLQWELDGAAPLAPMDHHSYNVEQFCYPLPDIQEWYEAKWLRRGVYQNGVQLRYPEEMQIRIEHDGEQCTLTHSVKKPEKDAVWTAPHKLMLSTDALERMHDELDRGFWYQPKRALSGIGGETETSWSICGYRPGMYLSRYRSYEEYWALGDPVHELGKAFARLANIHSLGENL